MKSVTLFLPATALSLAALAQATCNADNVLRALQRGGQPATSLCNSLIHYGIPTVTVVPPPGQTPPPAVVTSTSTLTQSVYPDGRVLEELNFPTFVSSYPASRVSSGCSCLLGPHPTTTLTSSGPTIVSHHHHLLLLKIFPLTLTTFFSFPFSFPSANPLSQLNSPQTQTTVTTSLSTLTGICASSTIPGAYSAQTQYAQKIINNQVSLSNAYACCNTCQNYIYGFCLAYWNVPGNSCNLLVVDRVPNQYCSRNRDTAIVGVNATRYPNQLGGPGPCADEVIVVP